MGKTRSHACKTAILEGNGQRAGWPEQEFKHESIVERNENPVRAILKYRLGIHSTVQPSQQDLERCVRAGAGKTLFLRFALTQVSSTRAHFSLQLSFKQVGTAAISFPESAILLVCAKDLELWDNPCQNSGYSRSDWLLYFTGSSLRAVSFKTGNENVE